MNEIINQLIEEIQEELDQIKSIFIADCFEHFGVDAELFIEDEAYRFYVEDKLCIDVELLWEDNAEIIIVWQKNEGIMGRFENVMEDGSLMLRKEVFRVGRK